MTDFKYTVHYDHIEITKYTGSDTDVTVPSMINGLHEHWQFRVRRLFQPHVCDDPRKRHEYWKFRVRRLL